MQNVVLRFVLSSNHIISKWKVDYPKITIDALSAIKLPIMLATPDIWLFVYTNNKLDHFGQHQIEKVVFKHGDRQRVTAIYRL